METEISVSGNILIPLTQEIETENLKWKLINLAISV